MADKTNVMRCSECKELFTAQEDAFVDEHFVGEWHPSHTKRIILCPVCQMRAMQRSINAS